MTREKKLDKKFQLYKEGKLSTKEVKELADEIKSNPEYRKFAITGALAMGKPALALHLLNY